MIFHHRFYMCKHFTCSIYDNCVLPQEFNLPSLKNTAQKHSLDIHTTKLVYTGQMKLTSMLQL